MKRFSVYLSLAAFLAVACHDATDLTGPSEPQFAKGGNKPDEGGTGKDIVFGLYEVEIVEAADQGFTVTVDGGVNAAVYEYLNSDTELTREFIANGNALTEILDVAAYFGCPDPDQPCSKVTIHFTGSAYSLRGWMANMVVGCGPGSSDYTDGCMNDQNLEERQLASTMGGGTFPELPWELLADAIVTDEETGARSFTYYWQGQRGMLHLEPMEPEKVRGKIRTTYNYTEIWDFLPDLHTKGTPETPIFSFGARVSGTNGSVTTTAWGSNRRLDNCTFDVDDCRGQFQGETGGDPLYMWIDLWDLDDTGRFEFGIQAFTKPQTAVDGELDYTDPAVLAANPESHSRVMMVSPGGVTRTMLNSGSWSRRLDGYDYKVGVAETNYVVDLTPAGCYEFHALSLVAWEDSRGFWEDSFKINRRVWEPVVGSDGVSDAVFHVDFDEIQGPPMALGSCGT